MKLNEIIGGLLEEIRKISGSENVVGKPIAVGDATIVPVCKIGIGFGTGAMEGKGNGVRAEGAFESGGAGGGIGVEPLAFLVVTKEGGAQLLSLRDAKDSVLGRAIDMVPQVVDKLLGEGSGEGAASSKSREVIKKK